jgi:hypothetical protein
LRYINELLAFPDDAFNFTLTVPADSTLYGAFAGSTLPYSGYVFYPTTNSNTRADYDVFTPPSLPHMQSTGEAPIFADESAKYPLLIYSHGAGDHPTGIPQSFLINLASHGYIVLALYHGDDRFEDTDVAQFNLRPLSVKTAIDTLIADSAFTDHIDQARIGGLGESLGGATMMALLGAKKIAPDAISVFTNALQTTTVDTRILGAATIVPYMGLGVYTFLGAGGTGAQTIDRPFMANSANSDFATDYSKVQEGMANIPSVKYLVEYDGEGHAMSDGAVNDAYTWMKLFSDAFIFQDPTAIDTLSRMSSVSDTGSDSLVLITEPAPLVDSVDTDSDGIPDATDTDDDNDGTQDADDAFPLDPTESTDTDGDTLGNNIDTDDDNDGILDGDDLYPLDSTNTPIVTSRLKNIATRGFVGIGDNVLIGGLVISGTENKTVIIRAKGPTLADAGVPNSLPDPQLFLFSGATVIDSNDDFQDHENANQIPTDLIPTNTRESVIVTTLAPGAYTAIVSGVNNEEGIGIVEVFEAEDTGETRMVNIATRGFIGTGDNVLIGGLVITGTGTKKLVIRAKGPSLSSQGVDGALANPQMFLFSGADVIDSNDDWQSHERADDIPANLQPTSELESVISTNLSPGAYTVIVQGVDGGTGIGIVEVFEVE